MKKRRYGAHNAPQFDQATKIIEKFGGERRMSELLGLSIVTIYRWAYARPYGCDGVIPTMHVPKIRTVARRQGILLTPDDWVPNRLVIPKERPPHPLDSLDIFQ